MLKKNSLQALLLLMTMTAIIKPSTAQGTCDPNTEFTCDNGNCIPSISQCDDFDDCEDNSDEVDCPNTCDPTQFTCDNGNCIPSGSQCDNVDDCGDNSDEVNCPILPPPIKCNSKAVKISLSPDNLADLCINETDKIVVSPHPFSVPGSIDSRCVSNYTNGSFYFNLTECDPVVEKYGNNFKFTWSVRKLLVASPDKLVARFDEDKCLELCCWYDATELVSSDEINAEIRKITVGSGSGSGSFSIEMTLYGNENLTTELTEDDDVEVPDAIYAVVDLEIAASNQRFVVQMEDCWATPSDNPCDPIQYELITEGCANKNDPGAMVEVTRNYKPSYGTFQFNSFLWVYDPEDPIYVHCKVRICDGYEYECNLTCDDVSKRDVSSREKDTKDVFSYGPIYVHSNKPSCSQDNGGCSDICSMLDNDVIVCSCPQGKSLMQDKKNCQKETEKLIDGQEMETTMMLAILLLAFVMLIISGGMMWKTHLIKANLPKQFA